MPPSSRLVGKQKTPGQRREERKPSVCGADASGRSSGAAWREAHVCAKKQEHCSQESGAGIPGGSQIIFWYQNLSSCLLNPICPSLWFSTQSHTDVSSLPWPVPSRGQNLFFSFSQSTDLCRCLLCAGKDTEMKLM